jgi:hypothetical protein
MAVDMHKSIYVGNKSDERSIVVMVTVTVCLYRKYVHSQRMINRIAS